MSGIESVRLQRTTCFGTCPGYEVEFRRDGTALWIGEAFVERLGEHRGQVYAHDFERLAEFVHRCGFFDWDPEYSGFVTDNPDYAITVSGDGASKRVRQYATDEPRDFWTLATLMDGIATRIDWSQA